MTETVVRRTSGPQVGPPTGALALLSTLMFVAGVAASAIAGGVIPSPTSPDDVVRTYFSQHSTAVLVTSAFALAASAFLAIFAGALASRLRLLGITRGGAGLVQIGGAGAVILTVLSGFFLWTLTRPEIVGDLVVVRALQVLAFASGGFGFAFFLGVILLGVAGPARHTGIVPGIVLQIGFVLAAVDALALVGMVWSPLYFLLPVARFGSLIWLTYVGFVLPKSRARG
ncbi:hypothetical protein [Fodinicola acaciae]|uniref:hypothetical protein n=1 Tax=Fodinicola acaciae TaxID=2681555 RepID=UPI0013D6D341|nr:hypothetical protein [Fodinicola acaciae]